MFKTYEMEKHFEREQKLQNMTEEDRKKFLQHENEIKKREHEGKKRVSLCRDIWIVECLFSFLFPRTDVKTTKLTGCCIAGSPPG